MNIIGDEHKKLNSKAKTIGWILQWWKDEHKDCVLVYDDADIAIIKIITPNGYVGGRKVLVSLKHAFIRWFLIDYNRIEASEDLSDEYESKWKELRSVITVKKESLIIDKYKKENR